MNFVELSTILLDERYQGHTRKILYTQSNTGGRTRTSGFQVRDFRCRQDCPFVALSVTEAESSLLRYLEEWGMTTIDDYMHGAHISRPLAEDIVIKLYSAGIVDFFYTGSEFKIVRVDTEDQL